MASRSVSAYLMSSLTFKLGDNTIRKFATISPYNLIGKAIIYKHNSESQLIFGSSKRYVRKCAFCQGVDLKCGMERHFHETRKALMTSSNEGNDSILLSCDKCSHTYNLVTHPTGTSQEDYINQFVHAVSCPKCGALQKTKLSKLPNYFKVLGQYRSYRVDAQAISNHAKQLQKKFHPDLYSREGKDQQDLSLEYSALINKAVSTLSDPIARGRYMLTLSGFLSDDANSDLEKAMTTDPAFLEEVMELNEKLEDITSESEWKEFRMQNIETMTQIQSYLEEAFDKDDMKEAQRLLHRMKYFDTLQQKLKEMQSKMGIVE